MHDTPNWLCELILGLSGHTYLRVYIVWNLRCQRELVSKLEMIQGVLEGFSIWSRGFQLALEAPESVPHKLFSH